jgi:hypothetical protein
MVIFRNFEQRTVSGCNELLHTMDSSDTSLITREPAVAGQFYPGQPDRLKSELTRLFGKVTDKPGTSSILALIAPHAGYPYSGSVAASAFAQLDPKRSYDQIFMIGSSHRHSFDGASVYTRGPYKTPLGTIPVNIQVSRELVSLNSYIKDSYESHLHEHSLEVLLPFLQYRLEKPFHIVPVIIATQRASTCRRIADTLRPYLTPSNLFVISTDFSHFPDYDHAWRVDHQTAEAIQSGDPDVLLKSLDRNEHAGIPGLSTCLCGWTSVLTLLYMTEKLPGIRYSLIDYRNSGDAAGMMDKSRVVGYCAMTIEQSTLQSAGSEPATSAELSPEEQRMLLDLAHEAIRSELLPARKPEPGFRNLTPALMHHAGVFVSLYVKGKLRGCIGRFTPDLPMHELVQAMAVSAAFHDHRFAPLKAGELESLRIEISILTPLRAIDTLEAIELGRHGIYIKKGHNTGTYLPQVALNTGWTRQEFVEHCASDKAGIGKNGWKDAELYVYEAFIIKDPPDRD